MAYARHAGRIGTLAAALGIGMAIATPVAFADPGDTRSASADSAPGAQTATTRAAAPQRGQRSAARQQATAPASAEGVEGSEGSERRQSAAVPRASAAVPVLRVDVPRAAVATNRATTTLTVQSVPTPAPVAATAPGAQAAPVSRPAPAVSTRRSAAASVTMSAPVVQGIDALLGGGPLGGAQSPAGWAALAVARRQYGRATPRTLTASVTTTSLVTGPNLLVNPGAELGDPSLSGFSSVTMPGWTMTGTPTVIKYGTPRSLWPIGLSFPMPNLPGFLGFPKAKSGPPDGGNQFFGGGDVTTGTLTQTVDLRGAADEIDLGGTAYNLSGWLGGFIFDPSGSSVKVQFLDENKTYLGDAQLNRVGALERWFQTGFKQRETSGTLPVGTRYAQVVLTLEDRRPLTFGLPFLAGGVDFDYNNAYADNLSFSISADLPAPPPPTPPVSTVGELDHVFMVYMENKGYDDIVNSTKAPFLNSLINAYGHANNYYGLTHPSLPNYYPVIGGTDFGLTYNCASPCIDADTTLVSNITEAGKTWKGYAQSLEPGANPLVASGDYSPDQLPFPAFKSIANDPAALANIVPLQQMAIDLQSAETAPNYAWFAANEDFNGEGPVDFPWGVLNFALSQLTPGNPYNIPALDQFLSETVPVVLNSNVWKDPTRKSALVVTFDEDNNNTSLGFGNEGNRVVFVVIPSEGAVAAGMRSGAFTATNHYNHYSLLRFIEDSLGLDPLTTNDRFAAPLNEFWTSTPGQAVGDITV